MKPIKALPNYQLFPAFKEWFSYLAAISGF